MGLRSRAAAVLGRRNTRRRRCQVLSLGLLLILAAAAALLHSAGAHHPRHHTWRLWDKKDSTGKQRLPGVSGGQSAARNTLEHFSPARPPTPVCLVVAWQQGDRLPAYVRTSLDTFGAAASTATPKSSSSSYSASPFAELYLFLPPSMGVRSMEVLYDGRRNWPSNVHAVDIGEVDPAWRQHGWLGFLSDNLCRLYAHGSHRHSKYRPSALTSWMFPWSFCSKLRKAVDKSLVKNRNPLVQLRPVYGDLFAPWINSERCSTWAWADLDTLWGDLPGLLNAPLLLSDSDVFTISFGDENRVYTRGQFTAFNHALTPAVDAAWRRCEDLESIEKATEFFDREGWAALDEGCAANAVISSGLRFTVIPIQEADGATLMRFDRGVLMACRVADRKRQGAVARAACRVAMRDRTNALLAAASPGHNRVSPFAAKATETQALQLQQPPDWESSCAGWLPSSETWCVKQGRLWDREAWWAQRVNSVPPVGDTNSRESVSQRHAYPAAMDPRKTVVFPTGQASLEIEVYEVAVLHMQGWKRHLIPTHKSDDLDARDLVAGSAVVEVYEEGEGEPAEGEERGVVLRVVRV